MIYPLTSKDFGIRHISSALMKMQKFKYFSSKILFFLSSNANNLIASSSKYRHKDGEHKYYQLS
ncbi:hypothetical protein BHC53_01365 [Snodgrassella alvi]|nr:hypothetical protein BHC53_01365 [Snodgrassella alvi]